jgi:hypothetical protein
MPGMAAATTISAKTREAFTHAIGSSRIARDILTGIEDHANAVRLRLDHRLMACHEVAAWPSKMTRRQLPGMTSVSPVMRRDAGLRNSSAVDRDKAADIANGILFDLIMEGTA